jgi:hypothetical protein
MLWEVEVALVATSIVPVAVALVEVALMQQVHLCLMRGLAHLGKVTMVVLVLQAQAQVAVVVLAL